VDDLSFKSTGIILRGFDVFDVVGYMKRTNGKYQATLLAEIESLDLDLEDYSKIRKLILDSTNNYLRTVVSNIFGGIEV
jgi:hypothetical protein